MEKNAVCHPLSSPVIRKFADDIEKSIASSSIVLSSNFQKYFGPDNKTLYIKGQISFIDSSVLEVSLYAVESGNTLTISKYRMHYMNNRRQMLFRYDNATHYPDIPSHPHHKHITDKIVSASMPSFKDVMNEISAIIIRS